MRLTRCCLLAFFYCCLRDKTTAQQGITYPPNPHANWHIISPSAFAPPPGKAVFQNGLLAASQYQKTTPRGNTYTIGFIPTLLLGESHMPLWVSAHRRVPIGRRSSKPVSVANLGGFFLSIPKNEGQNETQDFSLLYLNFTFGHREKNFSLGGAVIPTGLGQGIHPQAITLHGMTRLGRKSCLVTENYLIHNRGTWIPVSMSGWRGWRKQTAIDVGIMLTRIPASSRASNTSRWIPIPWLAVHKTLRYDIFNRGGE